MSKDIGEYNTCPHLCHYCYANTNNAAAKESWKRHCKSPHADTIAG
jgi:DNA repair photolyase